MNQFNFEPQRKHLHSIQRIPIIGTDEKMADRNDRWHTIRAQSAKIPMAVSTNLEASGVDVRTKDAVAK